MTQTSTNLRFLDRAPITGDLITVAPLSEDIFEVIALDDVYNEMVYAQPVGAERPAQWFFLTHAKVVDDEPAIDCRCGHPDCGAC